MAKICLIRPSILIPRNNQAAICTPPIGVAYVAGSLRHAGHAVTVIDCLGEDLDGRHAWGGDCILFGLSHEETLARIPADTEVIGVHAGFSFDWPACRDLVAAIRPRFPAALLIAGGEHATATPEFTLATSLLDAVVVGEGEETAQALVEAWSRGQPLGEVAGVVARQADGTIRRGAPRSRIRDIDAIAWPAWDLVPIRRYLDRGFGFGVNRGRSMPVLASRGCPYQCTFCSSPGMWTTRWLARDPEKLLEELTTYQREYGVTNFDFFDLTAIVKKTWISDFCRRIMERGLRFTWQLPSGTRSEAIDGEIASLLFAAGCRNLSYSPESGAPTVLERINKKISLDAMTASIRATVGNGLNVKCNIMLGFPGETWGEVLTTYGFIARMAVAGAHDLSVWAVAPYPGSELFEALRKDGRITLDDAYFDSLRSYADPSSTKSYSEHIPDRSLKLARSLGQILFYLVAWGLRPWRPVRILVNLVRGTHESRAEMGIANFLRLRWAALRR